MEQAPLSSGFHLGAPDARLRGFVDHYWLGLDNREPTYDIVPDGCVDIVLHVGSGGTRLWAYGTSTRLRRETIANGDYLGIRFQPGMARHFLSVAAHELTDRREALGRELAVDLAVLAGELRRPGLFGRIDGLLARQAAQAPGRPVAADLAARDIAATHGSVRVDALARRYGKSRRQLERDFLRVVGIPAKQFAVISRFRFAAARLRSAASLAALAADAGYADQSHMARDFRELAGASPSRWAGGVAFVQDA
jgi:AraC-like DNA-binding protein